MIRKAALIGGVMGLVAGCARAPERVIRLQGTVSSLGLQLPVPGAEVLIEWPAALGGGTTVVKTDTDGHYALGRTVRVAEPVCRGIAITVRAAGYASAYNRSDADCDPKVMTFDFTLFPITR